MRLNFQQRSISWTIQKDIEHQVELEDIAWWASRPSEPIPQMTPIPDSKPTTLSIYKFARAMLP